MVDYCYYFVQNMKALIMYHVQVTMPYSLPGIPNTLAPQHACSALYVVGVTEAQSVVHVIKMQFNTQNEE
jgi:hypothetical protein